MGFVKELSILFNLIIIQTILYYNIIKLDSQTISDKVNSQKENSPD